MKTLIILALAAVGGWYVFEQLKQNRDVKKAQASAVEATSSMRRSVEKAGEAAQAAGEAVKKTASRVEEAVK